MLGDTIRAPRMRNVLSLAMERAGWGRPLPSGWGRGVACHFTFGSYAAEVAEVSVDAQKRVRVHRVVAAVDCGMPVNRLGVEAQAQSGILDGVGMALHGEITVDRGRAVQSSFADYRLLRISEAPQVEVHIVDSREEPTGFGEIALPPCAGAIANAVYASSGIRVRRLPLNLLRG
jgi:isoquinoline 1-oxidoreductase beta subunit